ncbi:MAG: hypothetical protein ACKOJF_13375, partial [Planctomycetaceae bacterium]
CEPDLERQQRLGTEELVEVARRALATFPADRHQSVAELRGAVVRCRKHLVSVKAGQRARQTLESATVSADYAKALAQFEDARAGWNDVALEDSEWRGDPATGLGASASAQWQKLVDGENETRLRYAAHAESTENFELGLSLLSRERPDHAPLWGRLQQRLEESGRRTRLLTLFRRLAVGLLIATALAGGAASVQYYRAIAAGLDRDAAVSEKTLAEQKTQEAKAEQSRAVEARDQAATEALKAQDLARKANTQLEFASQQLAQATVDKNEAEEQTRQAQKNLEQVEQRRQQAEYASLVARFETAFEDGRWKDAGRLRRDIETMSRELNLPINSVLNAKFRELDRQLEPTDETGEPGKPADPAPQTSASSSTRPPANHVTRFTQAAPARPTALAARRSSRRDGRPLLRALPTRAPRVLPTSARTAPGPAPAENLPRPPQVVVADRNSPALCLELLSQGRFPLLTPQQRADGFLLRFSPGQLHSVIWQRHSATLALASLDTHPPLDRSLRLERPFKVIDLSFLGDTHLAVLANNLQEFQLEFFDLRDSAPLSRPVRVPLRLSRGATAEATRLATAPEPGNPSRHVVLLATRPKKAPDLRLLTISTAGGRVEVEESLVPDPEREWGVPQADELLPRHLATTWEWGVLAPAGRPPVAFRLADLRQSLTQLPVLPVHN